MPKRDHDDDAQLIETRSGSLGTARRQRTGSMIEVAGTIPAVLSASRLDERQEGMGERRRRVPRPGGEDAEVAEAPAETAPTGCEEADAADD